MAKLGVFGVGVATADPELRTVGQNNATVCTVNLAFNRSWMDKNEKWQNEACFVRAQVWGARAEKMAELVKKGQPIYVTGFMKQDSWEDKDDGKKRVAYSISIEDFQLCERNGKKKGDPQAVSAPATNTPTGPPVEDDNDIPF
jgi:single stranded DNA-binding protein